MNSAKQPQTPEWLQPAGWGLVVMLITCLPQLRLWWSTPLDGVFPWVLFNSDDHGVYFAWMRQAHDGHLLFRNLFTTDPQRGVYFHLYFLVLGGVARLTGLSIPVVYLLGRIVFGTVTLVLVYSLAGLFVTDRFTRWCVFWTTALSSGLGWVVWKNTADQRLPVDVWQPEAITFTSLYANGLFCVSLALMLGVVICLLKAETRGPRWAVGGGVCGLLLANIHGYDTIHLAAVWVTYLGLRWFVSRRFPAPQLRLAVIAAVIAAPGVAYMVWFYKTEPVFAARVDTATFSPAPWLYLAGFGLVIPLAIWGARLLWNARGGVSDGDPDLAAAENSVPEGQLRKLLPLGWAVAGLLVAYAPVAFQRKMIMGYHFPLSLLAGIAVAELARRVASRAAAADGARNLRLPAAAVLVLALSPSNWLYLSRDVRVALTKGVTSTGIHPVYWPLAQVHAFEWMGKHTPESASLLTFPTNGVFAPFWSGRAVYAGHWAETPDFKGCMRDSVRFYWSDSSEERLALLKSHGITHVLLSPVESTSVRAAVEKSEGQLRYMPQRPLAQEPFLTPVFQEGDTTLFEVKG